MRAIRSRDRSVSEISRKLESFGCTSDTASEVLQSLAEWGFLDDARLAAGIGSRALESGKLGRIGVAAQLVQRGLPEGLAAAVLMEYTGEMELEFARAIACRKAAQGQDLKKILRFLASRGFEEETLQTIAEEFSVD